MNIFCTITACEDNCPKIFYNVILAVLACAGRLPGCFVINSDRHRLSYWCETKFNPPKDLIFSKEVVIFTCQNVSPNVVK